jgi:hypothetical protein
VRAFGVNAWTGGEGDELIGAHDESSSGHEELYLVLEGSATFTVADETFAAPAGTVVFVRDPGLRRGAVAAAARTTIFTVGAKPGEPYAPPAREANLETFPYFDEGEYGRAKELLERALGEQARTPDCSTTSPARNRGWARQTERSSTCCVRWSSTLSSRASRRRTRTSRPFAATSGFRVERANERATGTRSPKLEKPPPGGTSLRRPSSSGRLRADRTVGRARNHHADRGVYASGVEGSRMIHHSRGLALPVVALLAIACSGGRDARSAVAKSPMPLGPI